MLEIVILGAIIALIYNLLANAYRGNLRRFIVFLLPFLGFYFLIWRQIYLVSLESGCSLWEVSQGQIFSDIIFSISAFVVLTIALFSLHKWRADKKPKQYFYVLLFLSAIFFSFKTVFYSLIFTLGLLLFS